MTSQSVPSPSTTACFSIARSRARRSSRSRAARSNSSSRAACLISASRRLAERLGLPGHEFAEVLGQLTVLLGADPLDARRRALADVTEQAGAADLAGPLEHPR